MIRQCVERSGAYYHRSKFLLHVKLLQWLHGKQNEIDLQKVLTGYMELCGLLADALVLVRQLEQLAQREVNLNVSTADSLELFLTSW